MHPTVIISAYRRALDDMLETLKEIRYADVMELTNRVRAKDDDGGLCVPARLWTRPIAP